MKKSLYALLLTIPSLAFALEGTPLSEMPAGSYMNIERHTQVLWKFKVLGLSEYIGTFKKVDAKLDLDPKDPTKSSLDVTIHADSVLTTVDVLDKRLKEGDERSGDKNFNVAEFPTITFKSNKIEKLTENTGRVHGTLTMLGVSKDLVLDTKYNTSYLKSPVGGTPLIGFSATGKLNRGDFGINSYDKVFGKEVDLQIEIWFEKPKEE